MSTEQASIPKFPNLFKPRKIGNILAPNSVKYAACSISNFNNFDGSITEREMARMETICKTGAGIITNQGAYPDPEGMGKGYYRQLSLADDKFLPAFERIAQMIHDNGAVAVQQILHAGRYGGIDHDYCLQSSDVPQTLPHFRPPRQMTKGDIRRCIKYHSDASRRVIRAGFDGVEITAFMGYLLANFLSPFTNDRTDEYGGSWKNRGRFMIELIQEIKEAIGEHPLWIRLNAAELMDDRGGNTERECLEYMKMAQDGGADGISIVIGWHESTKGALGRDVPTDEWLYLAADAKKELHVPIAFGPRFGDPIMAEKAIAEGVIDFWEVCRPFLADPELLIKVREDRLKEIKPCIGGLMCLARMFRNLPYVCSMNPMLGHEYEPGYHIVSTAHPKKILVIGGGPAGLEAALTAAKKGHKVSLFEQCDRLGGQLKSASMEIRGGAVFNQLIDSYKVNLDKHDVEVNLGTRVTAGMLRKLSPDVCIVATGASIKKSSLPGINNTRVIYADNFTEKDIIRDKKVIVIGSTRAGLVVAERLRQEGNEVAIVNEGKRLAEDVIPTFKWRHVSWVKELKIEVIGDTKAIAVSEEGLHLKDLEGNESVRAFDILVIAEPRRPNSALATELIFRCDELYTVGDAVAPRNVCNAVHEGYAIGVRV